MMDILPWHAPVAVEVAMHDPAAATDRTAWLTWAPTDTGVLTYRGLSGYVPVTLMIWGDPSHDRIQLDIAGDAYQASFDGNWLFTTIDAGAARWAVVKVDSGALWYWPRTVLYISTGFFVGLALQLFVGVFVWTFDLRQISSIAR